MTDRMLTAPSTHYEMHLTEDQLDDHLIGDLAAGPASHLAACARCTALVADALAPIHSFQAVTLAWGERRSATAPMPSMPSPSAIWERRLAWSMAVATCAAGLGLMNATHRLAAFPHAASTPAFTQTASGPTADHISQDNQLLNTIDRELAVSNDSPAALGLVPVGAVQTRAGSPAFQD